MRVMVFDNINKLTIMSWIEKSFSCTSSIWYSWNILSLRNYKWRVSWFNFYQPLVSIICTLLKFLDVFICFTPRCLDFMVALKNNTCGHLGGSVVECLPSAQVVIPGSWDRVRIGSLHFPLPVSASLSVTLMNK